LPSTSDHVRALARNGEPDHLAVMARRQTAGRGSRGRSWQSPDGNLSLSLLLRPAEAPRDVGQWALLAGLALAEALGAAADDRIRLKWPNDVLLEGHKLAGVLVDAESDVAGGVAWIVIGLGVNLAQAPALADRTAAALGCDLAPETLARRVMQCVSARYRQRVLGGFAPIRAAWSHLAQPLGTAMTVKLPRGAVMGRFAGLNEDGNLLLQTPDDGIETIVAGEIWTSAPANAPHVKEAGSC
jgi:BirA family biotin operon repressor/biotin-[acetyl-CoA-carboxylase] ligase